MGGAILVIEKDLLIETQLERLDGIEMNVMGVAQFGDHGLGHGVDPENRGAQLSKRAAQMGESFFKKHTDINRLQAFFVRMLFQDSGILIINAAAGQFSLPLFDDGVHPVFFQGVNGGRVGIFPAFENGADNVSCILVFSNTS